MGGVQEGVPRVVRGAHPSVCQGLRSMPCHYQSSAVTGELTSLWAVMSSTVEVTVVCSPDETFWVEVVDKLVIEF
jgi:hypothetical protein